MLVNIRQAALDAAYAAHPERFPHGPPRVAMPPTHVHINPLEAGTLSVLPEQGDQAHASDAADTSSLTGNADSILPRQTASAPATLCTSKLGAALDT